MPSLSGKGRDWRPSLSGGIEDSGLGEEESEPLSPMSAVSWPDPEFLIRNTDEEGEEEDDSKFANGLMQLDHLTNELGRGTVTSKIIDDEDDRRIELRRNNRQYKSFSERIVLPVNHVVDTPQEGWRSEFSSPASNKGNSRPKSTDVYDINRRHRKTFSGTAVDMQVESMRNKERENRQRERDGHRDYRERDVPTTYARSFLSNDRERDYTDVDHHQSLILEKPLSRKNSLTFGRDDEEDRPKPVSEISPSKSRPKSISSRMESDRNIRSSPVGPGYIKGVSPSSIYSDEDVEENAYSAGSRSRSTTPPHKARRGEEDPDSLFQINNSSQTNLHSSRSGERRSRESARDTVIGDNGHNSKRFSFTSVVDGFVNDDYENERRGSIGSTSGKHRNVKNEPLSREGSHNKLSYHHSNSEIREDRDRAKSRDGRDNRERELSRENSREFRDARESISLREGRDGREARDQRDGRDTRDGRDGREREGREREGRDLRTPSISSRYSDPHYPENHYSTRDSDNYHEPGPYKKDEKEYNPPHDRKDISKGSDRNILSPQGNPSGKKKSERSITPEVNNRNSEMRESPETLETIPSPKVPNDRKQIKKEEEEVNPYSKKSSSSSAVDAKEKVEPPAVNPFSRKSSAAVLNLKPESPIKITVPPVKEEVKADKTKKVSSPPPILTPKTVDHPESPPPNPFARKQSTVIHSPQNTTPVAPTIIEKDDRKEKFNEEDEEEDDNDDDEEERPNPYEVKKIIHEETTTMKKDKNPFADGGKTSIKKETVVPEPLPKTTKPFVETKKLEAVKKSEPAKEINFVLSKGENILGSGSYATVYKAMDMNTGGLLAAKEIRMDGVTDAKEKQDHHNQLKVEVELMSKLDHANIVHYLGHSTRDEKLYIMVEYMAGGSIKDVYESYSAFSEVLTSNFSKQILEGLSYLHKMGVIHRDIKGGNLLLTDSGTVKLADFGCSFQFEKGQGTVDQKTFEKVGSVPWMAPEMVRQRGTGRKSDIWSFGCTVIEMLTAKRPWSGDWDVGASNPDQMQLMYQIASTPTGTDNPKLVGKELIAAISPVCLNFLKCCLQKKQDDRYSAEQLLEHPFIKGGGTLIDL